MKNPVFLWIKNVIKIKNDPKTVSSDDVTAVDEAMDDVMSVDSYIKEDVTLIDDETTIVDAGNDDVTQVD